LHSTRVYNRKLAALNL